MLATHCLSLTLLAGLADVIVVAPTAGPGVDYTDLPLAVANAADGDIVLVKPGGYISFQASDKNLTVVGDVGGTASINYLTSVGTGPGQELLLSNLSFGPTNHALNAGALEGHLWLDRCSVRGNNIGTLGPNHAMSLFGFDGVLITDCQIEGETPGGGAGLLATDTTVHAWNSTFEGGLDELQFLANGGTGAQFVDSFLYAADCFFEGGIGTDGFFPGECIGPGDGGTGLALIQSSGSGVAELASSSFAGGFPGTPDPLCPAGSTGEGLTLAGGATASFLTVSSGINRAFAVEPPVIRSGQQGTMTIQGRAGELAFVGLSDSLAAVYLPGFQGSLALANPLTILDVGVLDAAGSVTLPFDVSLPPGVEGVVARAQSLTFGAVDGLVVGAPSPVVLVAATL